MSKGDQTRERIIAKAAELFNQRGLEGTSMADLMEATGLEKGGIYRHFPSKEAVAAEASITPGKKRFRSACVTSARSQEASIG